MHSSFSSLTKKKSIQICFLNNITFSSPLILFSFLELQFLLIKTF
jgi:hypothetical protein